MRFEYPSILWLLLVLPPALAVFFSWAMRRKQELMTQFIQARLLPGLTVGISPGRQRFRFGCIVLVVALLIVALARPQWGYHFEEVKQRGLDIAVAIDTSKSMLAEDIAPNRLQRAKLAALDLMQQAKSDRLGLIAFAGGAFLQCPLTIDDTAFRQSVESLDVTTIPQGGTALAEAINTALEAFKERDNYKVLVIFTDGEDNDEGAMAAAEAAAKEGLRIYTVGIGTAEGELLRISDNKGRTDYVRDEQGNVVKSHLNEALLQQIAAATEGGVYLRLAGAKTVDTLYERFLSTLPKSEQTARLVRQYHEQFHWPLAAAILLLVVEMLLPEGRRAANRTKVRSSGFTRPEPSRDGRDGTPNKIAPVMTAVLALLLLPCAAFGSSSSALRDYNSGKYDEALKEYQRVLQHKTNDARLQFNTGAAAYRNDKYDEAAKQFARATTAQSLNVQQRAYYNLGNTLYREGEGENDSDKKKEIWESSLKQYDGAIKLNTNDADAKFNSEFVKKKLEELKKQEQKQDDQKKDQQQDQKQDQEKKQQDQQQNKQDQQKQDQAQNDKQDQQKQDSNQKQDQQQSQQKKDEQQKEQAKNKSDQQKEKEKKEQQQAKSGGDKEKEKSDEQREKQQAEARGVRPMTPQEAQQLLDAQKGDDKVLQLKPAEQQKNSDRPIKDW